LSHISTGVEHFSQYFHRPPDQLGPEHIRQYQAMLFTELKLSPNTVIVRLAALRFFYIHVLKRNWSIAKNRIVRPSSTVAMNRHSRELKCASANKQPDLASNFCPYRLQENDK
jgi:site-specific recombinase XerD